MITKNYSRTAALSLVLILVLTSAQELSSAPELSAGQEEILKELPLDQQASIRQKMVQQIELKSEIDALSSSNTLVERPKKKELSEEEIERQRIKQHSLIYGYDLFANAPTTFAPATNIPLPIDYVLGPGDVLSLNIQGVVSNNQKLEIQIKRDATIDIPGIKNSIGVGGLELDEARKLINLRINEQFLGGSATVSVKELRSIQIFVLGDAYMPGAYTVSSLTTISNALYVSGGVSEKGSLRNIQLKREGKLIRSYDLYDLLLSGDTSKDARLQTGDVIFIPIIKKKVRIQGAVRRPALFEMTENETLEDLISLASGLTPESLPNSSELNRVNQEAGIREIKKISTLSKEFLSMEMKDGDIINIPSIKALDEINIRLTGQFKFPGTYSIKNGDKLSELLKRSGGFTKNAYLYGAVFTRKSVADLENSAYQSTVDTMENEFASAILAGKITTTDVQAVSQLIGELRGTSSPGRLIADIDPINLSADPEKDFYLEDGDRIHVPLRRNSITIVGDVFSPSTIPYRDSYKTKDYIKEAGGYKWGADKSSVFLILPNGQSRAVSQNIWRISRYDIAPGSTIVVPKSTRPFDWLILAETITPVLSNLATSAAALAAIDD